MAKKDGPSAANGVKKSVSMLFNFAPQKLDFDGPNPAKFAERLKENSGGYHTWTEEEVIRFLAQHGAGTKARMALLVALNTGMARQDLCRAGRDMLSVRDGRLRINYARGKTAVAADLPVLPELANEIARLPQEQSLFITKEKSWHPYKVTSFGNWFQKRCQEAGVPGSIHGLRKAGATRLADAGASEWEMPRTWPTPTRPKRGLTRERQTARNSPTAASRSWVNCPTLPSCWTRIGNKL